MNTIFSLSLKSAARQPFLLFWSILIPIGGTLILGFLVGNPDYAIKITTGMMAMGILFYTFTTTVFSLLGQRRRGVYQLLKVTPMPLSRYIISVSGAWTLVSLICAMLVLTVGVVFFQLDLALVSVVRMGIVCVVGATGYVFFSFFVSGLCQTEAQTSIATNLIAMPLLLGSDAFYSLEAAPAWVKTVILLNPFQWLLNGLRSGFSGNNRDWAVSLVALLIFLGINLFLAVGSFKSSDH
ncbi:MAG: ABC transporter permease [Firmicutes bacterium HGW-Firmicutes-5]|nr:MAG: ABC transporter permease [Firmicutes bacterium HGW-Firmicutes-5]